MTKLTMKDLKSSKFKVVIYIDNEYGTVQTKYFVNVNNPSIKKILESKNYKLLSINDLTFEEYIRSNFKLSEIMFNDTFDKLNVEFYQCNICVCDKIFNSKFPLFELTPNEIIEIATIQNITISDIENCCEYDDWEYISHLFNNLKIFG